MKNGIQHLQIDINVDFDLQRCHFGFIGFMAKFSESNMASICCKVV